VYTISVSRYSVSSTNDESENFETMYDFNNTDNGDEILDRNFTIEEITAAVKTLKRNKSPGNDFLLNEYFIESIDILGCHICDIFNCILDSGFFPESWTEGVIIPLHKKGDVNNVNNYRGITLVSCLSKLFTTILNKRIMDYCEQNNL
jgi:hypothetical protein